MPLGNSITQADSNHDSYRRPLWKLLQESGYDVDFVGTQRKHHLGSAPNDDFDQDHEGHWGWRTDEILYPLQNWLSTTKPDAVLVHLGTNDMLQARDVDETLELLAAVINTVRATGAVVFLAKLIPTANRAAWLRIQKLNAGIESLALEPSGIFVVDQSEGFDSDLLTYDGLHPNAAGERRMAETWFEALKEIL